MLVYALSCHARAQLKRLRGRYNPRTARFEPPSGPTIRRLLHQVDVAAVDAALSDWLLAVSNHDDAIGVDGEVVRWARREDGSQVHLLSAFLHDQGITIAKREIPAKTNEIPELKPLLAPLSIAGKTLTADALHTQGESARLLVEKNRRTMSDVNYLCRFATIRNGPCCQ